MAHKELRAIVEAHAQARRQGRDAALVTVVKTSGSTYRRPGARMLVLPADGGNGAPPDSVGADFLGSISGGCLEDDARERALATLATGHAVTVHYDTTAEGDVVFGTGLGCQGIVHVLLQPLPACPRRPSLDPVDCIARSLSERRAGALASVIRVESPPDQPAPAIGDMLWISSESKTTPAAATFSDPSLADAVAADARASLRGQSPCLRVYPLPGGGRVEVFIDVIRPPRSLLICGAGHDAVPLSRLGKELGWRVRVVDGRRAYLAPGRFSDVDELTHCPPGAFAERITVEPGESAVLMTHNYLHDRAILRALLASPAAYIGVLGPRLRTDRLLAELAAEAGVDAPFLAKTSLRRLHGPCGLDIGAEAPEQIALAIIAEIEAVGARRKGGLLKKRRAPLHAAAPA